MPGNNSSVSLEPSGGVNTNKESSRATLNFTACREMVMLTSLASVDPGTCTWLEIMVLKSIPLVLSIQCVETLGFLLAGAAESDARLSTTQQSCGSPSTSRVSERSTLALELGSSTPVACPNSAIK